MKISLTTRGLSRWTAVIVSVTVCCLASLAGAQTRIATVDLGKVLTGYQKTRQAEEILKSQGLDLEKAQKAMLDEYKKAKEEHTKLLDSSNNQALSREERERCQKASEAKLLAIKEIELSLNRQEREAQATFEEQRRRIMENLLREIRAAIAAKAKAANFGLVLDSSTQAAGPVSVLYASGENDVTEEIIKQLNAGLPLEPTDSGNTKGK